MTDIYCSKVSKLSNYIKFDNEISTLEQLECSFEVSERISKLNSFKDYIICSINNLTDSSERNVLLRKYVLGETHQVISEKLNYSETHIKRIHKRAIEHIDI